MRENRIREREEEFAKSAGWDRAQEQWEAVDNGEWLRGYTSPDGSRGISTNAGPIFDGDNFDDLDAFEGAWRRMSLANGGES